MTEEMIFRAPNEKEVQILKLLKLHLPLGHRQLGLYMELRSFELNEPILHLEREGLLTAKFDGVSESVYCITTKGMCLVPK